MNLTKTLTLPDGQSAVIRKLTWKQLKEAGKKQASESYETMREIGAELLKALRDGRKTEADDDAVVDRMERMQKAQARKPSNYDVEITLIAGVESIAGQPVNIDELDPATAEALHEAIVAYAYEVPEKNA